MKNRRASPLILALLCLLGLGMTRPVVYLPTTFVLAPDAEQIVRVYAKHSFGTAEGALRATAGTLTFDPSQPTYPMSGRFTVDVASLDTGNKRRDRHMRREYLETEQYPEALFVLEEARPTRLDNHTADTLSVAVTGAMTLHGVTRPHTVQARVFQDGEGYRVEATFSLRLTDYAITPPKRLVLKVKDEIRLAVALSFNPQTSG